MEKIKSWEIISKIGLSIKKKWEYLSDYILSIIKETLLTKIKGNINDKLNDEININENYLVLNKLFYAMKDYVLLVIKYKADQNIKYFENENKIYSLIIQYIDKLYEKYKKNKQSEYDKQKIPLLYSTKLPNDISNYIIKEFL